MLNKARMLTKEAICTKDAILYKVFYGGIIPSRTYLTTKLIYFKSVKIRLRVRLHCATSLFLCGIF